MKITIGCQKLTEFTGDALIVNLFQGVQSPAGATGAVDQAIQRQISALIKRGDITGKLGEVTTIHTFGRLKVNKVLVIGLGKRDTFGLEEIRKASGAVMQQLQKTGARRVGTIVHGAGIGGIEPHAAAQALAEGSLLSLYTFREYKKPEKKDVQELRILEIDTRKLRAFKKGVEVGTVLAESQNCSRDLINEPANNLTPRLLEKRIRSLIARYRLQGRIKLESLHKTAMKKMGMGALLSVSQGSANEPCFMILRYRGARKPLTCLIGKTVTFDSGGISIKASTGMGRMKGDMSGGAAVIGVVLALARLRKPVNLIALIPAVENMPSGTASRPGDVVRAMNGKSIEIISTDAEGRMTLADALCYAEHEGAATTIDIATLTGGCIVALGEIAAAIMGNNRKLINSLLKVSEKTGERFWELPLFDEYKEQIKSDVADVKNSGGRSASTITAGMFLRLFVDKTDWLHIDIAGKEFVEKASFYTPVGGTGFGVRSLFELLITGR